MGKYRAGCQSSQASRRARYLARHSSCHLWMTFQLLSKVRLFVDDCVMYREVSSDSDCIKLQDDLNRLEEWECKWCMQFNAMKCSSIPITRKRNKQLYQYTLQTQPLEQANSATYLGVELSSDLTWAKHIKKTCNKANRNLGFIRRNLPIRNSHVKEIAYKGLVRPILEYCSTVWDILMT